MAVIRLALEIDGDVYPELHAMLSLIASGDAKAERVRQLAASGLLWETVRIYGSAAIGPNPVVAAAASAASAEFADVRIKPRAAAKPNARSAAKGRRAGDESGKEATDFVDLAIDAVPPSEQLPQVLEREAESVVRQLPVLLDVVIPEASTKPARQRKAAVAPPPEPPQEPVERAAEPAEVDAKSSDHTHETLHLASLAQKPATRSRLMRMKEKGLFKNG